MTIKINGTNTAANPSITGTDTDTGIVYGSDQIDFSIGGTSKLTLDSSGNLLNLGQYHLSDGGTIRGQIFLNPSDTDDIIINAVSLGSNIDFKTVGTQRMRLDSSGRLALGTTSPSHVADFVGANETTFDHIGTLGLQGTDAYNSGNAGAGITFSGKYNNSGSVTSLAQISGIKEDTGDGTFDGALTFGVRNDAQGVNIERARIDSAGNLNLDTSSNPLPNNSAALLNMDVPQGKDGINIKQDSTHHCINIWRSASDGNVLNFYRGSSQGGSVGIISINSTSTTYATSSDYRLKENASAISDGITRLKTLKPYRFNFKVEPSRIVDGFFAHEVSLIVPEAITGIKDEVNENNEPIYQAIDQSKLVPLLTAALQEAIAKIEVLETKVAALEAA